MRRSLAIAASGLIVVALAGCSSSTAGSSSASAGTVHFAIASDPGDLNPLQNATSDSSQLAAFAYESLLSAEAGKAAVGLLAESWTETNTGATFTLKDGVTCSDGSALTASDVKATFDYVTNSKNGSPYLGVYAYPDVSVTADDDTGTVTFTATESHSFLADALGALPIVCASGLADPEALDTKTFGTGPYQLTASVAGQSYEYGLRTDYTWGPDGVTSTTAGLPVGIDVQVVSSGTTQVNMLSSGQLNLALVSSTDLARLTDSSLTKANISAGPSQIFFNQADGRATSDLAVRTAIAQALDRDAVGKVATGGTGTAMKSLLPNTSSVCSGMDNAASIPAFDAVAAATSLDSDGWTLGSDGVRAKDGKKLSLKLLYSATLDTDAQAAIELIQKDLTAIGIAIELSSSSSYTDVIFSGGDWDIVWAPIVATTPAEWAGILTGEFPPDGGNWTYNANTAYKAAVADAQKLSGDASCTAWSTAEAALFSEVDVLPFWESFDTFVGDGVTVTPSAAGFIMPTTIRMS